MKIITIVDDFLGDAFDSTVKLAESLSYEKQPETKFYPGLRTECLSIAAPEYYAEFCSRLLDVLINVRYVESITANITTYFQKIDPHTNSQMNAGWIHQDQTLLSGVLYLSPHPGGTNLNDPITEDFAPDNQIKYRYYNNDPTLDEQEYITKQNDHNSKFISTLETHNKQDRIFIFPGECWHNATTFESHTRLTQVFFLHSIDIKQTPQIEKEVFVKDHWIQISP